jgi:hypothetical protein
MKPKQLSLGVLILCFVSCNTGPGTTRQVLPAKTDPAMERPSSGKACDTTSVRDSLYTIRNDRVISAALETILACRSLDSVFRNARKDRRKSPNRYETKNVDTTVTYQIDCDSVTYLRSKANCFPLRLNIQSQRLSFDNGALRVGMTKEKFIDRFQLKHDVPDVLKVSDLEGSNELLFFFSNGVLSKIIYNNLYVE